MDSMLAEDQKVFDLSRHEYRSSIEQSSDQMFLQVSGTSPNSHDEGTRSRLHHEDEEKIKILLSPDSHDWEWEGNRLQNDVSVALRFLSPVFECFSLLF